MYLCTELAPWFLLSLLRLGKALSMTKWSTLMESLSEQSHKYYRELMGDNKEIVQYASSVSVLQELGDKCSSLKEVGCDSGR